MTEPVTAAPEPLWLTALAAYHAAAPNAAVVLADAIVVTAAVMALGTPRAGVLAGAAGFMGIALLAHVYERRGALEVQGVAWYLRAIPLPALALVAGLSVAGGTRASQLLPRALPVVVVLGVLRAVAWVLVASARRRGLGLEPALIIGPEHRTEQVARRISAFPEAGLFVTATYAPTNTNGHRSRAHRLLRTGGVQHLLIATTSDDDAAVQQCVAWSEGSSVEIGLVLPVGAPAHGASRIGDLSVVSLGRSAGAPRFLWAKRALDVLLSGLLLFLLAPVFVIVSLAIWLYDRGPVFYRQRRVGRDNREFTIWKFRSMVPGADQLTDEYAGANMASGLLFKLPDDPRVTPVGDLIRRLSIDELPQLFNVLIGDMSLVGPRPLPVAPEDFDPVAAKRHRVRPGITGPWQVAGGHVLGYEDMIKLDLAYIDTWSLRRDLWYLAMTVPTVLVRRSVY